MANPFRILTPKELDTATHAFTYAWDPDVSDWAPKRIEKLGTVWFDGARRINPRATTLYATAGGAILAAHRRNR